MTGKMKPILFSTPMVQALLEGRKTQTRRVIKPQPDEHAVAAVDLSVCAPYKLGDVLYVREAWADIPDTALGNLHYKASATETDLAWFKENGWKWRPSIHMPREVARIFLRVTDVRVERVRDISDDDAIAEGCAGVLCNHPAGRYACEDCMNTGWLEPPQVEYMQLWDALNAKRGFGWDENPWVWVYTFERVEEAQNEQNKD